jgi:mono/diheme cytochrome c family protein
MYRMAMLAAVSLVQFPTGVCAQEPGDTRAGLAYAKTNCSQCHEIERRTKRVPGKPPAFAEIANSPGMTGRGLAAALDTSHKAMPDFILARDDRDDVIAYILSLRSPDK